MTILFALFLAVHGLIHLLGAIKASGLADLPQLTRPIPPPLGVLWLVAALLFLGAAASLLVWPRWWWLVGAAAILVSTTAIVPSWSDAKFGAAANLIALAGVMFGFLAHGPFSLRTEYARDLAQKLAGGEADTSTLTEAEVAPLPAPVRRYLRLAGVVGQPRVRNFRVRMHGRIRGAPDAAWMPFTAEQHNFILPKARLFYMTAARMGIPAQGYHRYLGDSATMRVKAAALVLVQDVAGPEMLRGETVTLFNDMCVMAPATLIDPAIEWEAVDDRRARAAFSNAGITIRAELVFNGAGELTDFVSDDRSRLLADRRLVKMRWSTPVRGYRSFGSVRLPSGGEGKWHGPDGEFTYIELTLDAVTYNVRSPD